MNEPLPPRLRRKCVQYRFENKDVGLITIVRTCDAEIVRSLPTSSVKFPTRMMTYKLTPSISTTQFQ